MIITFLALPENIPPAEPIKNIEKRLKTTKFVLELEDKDAAGLIPMNRYKDKVCNFLTGCPIVNPWTKQGHQTRATALNSIRH